MKSGVEKSYHPNGLPSGEVTYVDGKVNGCTRSWHVNGVLAKEIPVSNNKENGEVRQWNSKGVLLGCYNIVNGTGTKRIWYEEGQLQGELDVRDENFHGRLRAWFVDGTLASEEYYVSGRKVSKKKYMELAPTDPTLPRYYEEGAASASVVPRPSEFLRAPVLSESELEAAKSKDLFCEKMLNSKSAIEARKWFDSAADGVARTLGELQTTEESYAEIAEAYASGATRITVVKIDAYPDNREENSGKLVITLPNEAHGRSRVLAWCAKWALEAGHEPDKDIGQRYVFVVMD